MLERHLPLDAISLYEKASSTSDGEDKTRHASEMIGRAARLYIRLERSVDVAPRPTSFPHSYLSPSLLLFFLPSFLHLLPSFPPSLLHSLAPHHIPFVVPTSLLPSFPPFLFAFFPPCLLPPYPLYNFSVPMTFALPMLILHPLDFFITHRI